MYIVSNAMYTEFAYSSQMQLILAFITLFATFINLYFIADIILRVYKEHITASRIALYALLMGAALHGVWVYGFHFLLGGNYFPEAAYLLITTPNPGFAVLYYVFGVKVLKSSKVRSFTFMGKVYLFHMLTRSINRIVKSLYLGTNLIIAEPYNYLKDATVQVLCLAVFLLMYVVLRLLLKAGVLRMTHAYYNVFSDYRREWAVYVAKSVFVYSVYVLIPYFIPGRYDIFANSLLIMVLSLFYALCVYYDYRRALAIDVANRDAYIKTLAVSLLKSGGVRHDLRNILNTYGGYLELGMLDKLREYHASVVNKVIPQTEPDLNARLDENPALVSLIKAKAAYAQNMDVALRLNLDCELSDFFIDNLDLCRILGNLADNAIEAAAESEQKRVAITTDAKSEENKLIVITNSTKTDVDVESILLPGETTKSGHSGIGLPNVRRIVSQYGNCVFRITYSDLGFMAYLELKKY